jgi:hypothetical protein
VHDHCASLPAMASARSSSSDTSGPTQDISRCLELHNTRSGLRRFLRASTDAAINKVMSLFCTQFQESAARGLDDSQVDARGELDFHLVKDIVEQGRAEARAMI